MKIKAPAGQLVAGLHEWSRYHYDTCEAVNWSSLKLWKGNCPAKATWLEDNFNSDLPHFRFGEQVHCRVLEPERWKQDYAVQPACWSAGGGHLRATPKSTTPTSKEQAADNREERDRWLATAKGKEIVPAEDGGLIEAMARRVEEHPITGPIVKQVVAVRTELACVSQMEDGTWLKNLMDLEVSLDATEAHNLFDPHGKLITYDYFESGVWLGDLKTTSSGAGTGERPGSWGYTVAKYDYLGQAAFYIDNYERATGIRPAGFFFIPVEKEPPHEVAIYFVTDEQIAAGRRLYKRLLSQRKMCVATQNFPGYTEYMHPMMVPGWGMERR